MNRELRKRTRRSFLVGGTGFLAGFLGWRWIGSRREEQGLPWPLRKVLEINEGIFGDFFGRQRYAPSVPPVTGKQPRENGDLGLGEARDFGGYPDYKYWRVQIITPSESGRDRALTRRMRDFRAHPRTEYSFAFKCIEGWKDDMTVAGVRFSDFLASFDPGQGVGRDDQGELYPYVSLATPDGKYYVSIDMESMLHPQTLLCYEMNGQPISFENGAPLRLMIPVKYGIKSLKQIGRISFSYSRPADYWAERGYDWYAGL